MGARELYERYTTWADVTATNRLDIKKFKQELERRGIRQKRNKKGCFWEGVCLGDASATAQDEAA